jgi:hypothetical protein
MTEATQPVDEVAELRSAFIAGFEQALYNKEVLIPLGQVSLNHVPEVL